MVFYRKLKLFKVKYLNLILKYSIGEPIFAQLAKDTTRIPYITALRSFKSRTCYGNVNFDNNVGWCNSTIRTRKEAAFILEDLRKVKRVGSLGKFQNSPEKNSYNGFELYKSKFLYPLKVQYVLCV